MRARTLAFAVLVLAATTAHAGIVIDYEGAMTRHRDGLRTLVVCEGVEATHERWRVLEFDIYAQSFLYVDRLRVDTDDATWHHVEHFEFSRINDDHVGAELRDLTCKGDGDGVRIEGWAMSGHEPCEQAITAVVRPGHEPEWTQSDPVCDVGEAE